MLRPLLCQATELILVKPHYPENVGAAARAAKTMGLTRLCLVSPSRLATPDSEMAFKMAVRAWDVLETARICETLAEALRGHDHAFATTARRGQKGLQTPREAAQLALQFTAAGKQVAVVFGNEKTGLSPAEVDACEYRIRIPMAADQPSINLAQSCQLVAYEWFLAGSEDFGVER